MSNTFLHQDWEHNNKQAQIIAQPEQELEQEQEQERVDKDNVGQFKATAELNDHEFRNATDKRCDSDSANANTTANAGVGNGVCYTVGVHTGGHASETGGCVRLQCEDAVRVAAAVAPAMCGPSAVRPLADRPLHMGQHIVVEAMAKLEISDGENAVTAMPQQQQQQQQPQQQQQQQHTPTAEYSGSDSGVDVQLQRGVGVLSAADDSVGLVGSQHGLSLNLSGDSSLLSMNSSELNEPHAHSNSNSNSNSNSHCGGGADSSDGLNHTGPANVSFETISSENGGGTGGSANSSLNATTQTNPQRAQAASSHLRRSQSVKKRVALNEPNNAQALDKEAVHGTLRGATSSQTRSRLGNTLKRTQSLSRPTYVGSQQLQLHLQSPSGVAMRVRQPLSQQATAASATASKMSSSMTMSMTMAVAGSPPSRLAASQLSNGQRAITPSKPDCWPSALSRNQSVSMQRLVQRTPSLSRARTPGTPSDDGRWPSTTGPYRSSAQPGGHHAAGGSKMRGMSVTPDLHAVKLRGTALMASSVVETKSSVYGTLPRRRKPKSVEDLTARSSRSSSLSRESRGPSTPAPGAAPPSTATMSSTPQHKSTRRSLANTPAKTFSGLHRNGGGTGRNAASRSMATASATPHSKTRIYHETSAQTALTGEDLTKLFAGENVTAPRPVDAAEQRDQHTQSDIRDRDMERLQEEVRQLTQREQDLSVKLKREREEKLAMQQELHQNAQRVVGILQLARISVDDNGDRGPPTDGGGGGGGHNESHGSDSLLMLESQIHEIGRLRRLCRSLQTEIDRSLAMQECLLQEKAAIEQESTELQDFLQHEKAAMCEALKDLESDHQMCQQRLTNRDEEVKVLRDECRHLVRLNEQRRQENSMLQSKYSALESKSKDLLLQQNYSMSGASAALAGLHSRLDSLVEQLVTSYSISEQDLEDLGFQNDGSGGGGPLSYDPNTTNNSSLETMDSLVAKPNANGLDIPGLQVQHHLPAATMTASSTSMTLASDGSLSPQRNQSFIAAVISAIRNATTASGKKLAANAARHQAAGGCGTGANVAAVSTAVGGKRTNGSGSQAAGSGNANNNNNNNGNVHNNNNNGLHTSNGDDSDSTEMLDSETEPCLIMDNVLEDVTMPDSHSHNMVSSSCGGGVGVVGVLGAVSGGVMISQIEIPSELMNVSGGDESLQNLSQAIVNRQQMELQINAMSVQKVALHLSQADNSLSEDISGHDSLADLPSLAEYYPAQGVVDQAIELDHLVTKLLKVLRLIQMDNDNCIQQLIVDKNKLQQNKEDMLEKLKDIQDVNMKLQDELMDATQELMLKNTELTSSKTDMQRHRNEIDRLTEDICNLSTLCSNYKKLSPTNEFSTQSFDDTTTTPDDIVGILNLLKMWQSEGHLNDARLRRYLREFLLQNDQQGLSMSSEMNGGGGMGERLRIYANQLENVLRVLDSCDHRSANEALLLLQQLRHDIEIVKVNANWTPILCAAPFNNTNGIGDAVTTGVDDALHVGACTHTNNNELVECAATADVNANGVDV